MELFCLAAAKVLLETFPDAPKKLSAHPFSELNFRMYRERLSRRLVLDKLASLAAGVASPKDLLSILVSGDPFHELFSEEHWRQLTIMMVLQGGHYLSSSYFGISIHNSRDGKETLETSTDLQCG